MDLAEYTSCDATELGRLLAARELDAGEVREAALRAIEAVEPRLNAVVSGPYEDAASAGEGPLLGDGPVAGVPMAVKDTLPEAGRPLGFGSRLLDGFVAPRDATLAERFRAAGLVALVRTATPEFARTRRYLSGDRWRCSFEPPTRPVVVGRQRDPRSLSYRGGTSADLRGS